MDAVRLFVLLFRPVRVSPSTQPVFRHPPKFPLHTIYSHPLTVFMPLQMKLPGQAKKRKLDPSSSEEDSGLSAKSRKLKIYSVEEKIDIIDYAKIIGNRAAGREFNVAESSIREWRKNEEKLR